MTEFERMRQIDWVKIDREGPRIYERVRHLYEPTHKGEWLAIDVDSGKVYHDKDDLAAIEKGKRDAPEQVFYVVKIGYDVTDSFA